jgi:hypothetical protein
MTLCYVEEVSRMMHCVCIVAAGLVWEEDFVRRVLPLFLRSLLECVFDFRSSSSSDRCWMGRFLKHPKGQRPVVEHRFGRLFVLCIHTWIFMHIHPSIHFIHLHMHTSKHMRIPYTRPCTRICIHECIDACNRIHRSYIRASRVTFAKLLVSQTPDVSLQTSANAVMRSFLLENAVGSFSLLLSKDWCILTSTESSKSTIPLDWSKHSVIYHRSWMLESASIAVCNLREHGSFDVHTHA